MAWKIGAACAVIASCILIARALTGALFRRCRILDELIGALGNLRISVVERLEPLSVALASSGARIFEMTAQEIRHNVSASEAWNIVRNAATARGEVADAMGEEELSVLDALFGRLGKTGCGGQELSIRSCVSSLEEIRATEKSRLDETSKLYTKLGILTGLAAVVLIL